MKKSIKVNYLLIKGVEGEYVGELHKEISLGDSFLLQALEIYLGKEFKSGEITNELVKVVLPSAQDKAIEVLKNGIEYNGVKYTNLLSTPNMMKKEYTIEEEGYKLEYLFIKEENKEFKATLERLLSANKLAEKRANKEKVCVNKDITSRIALATSDSSRVNYKPHICIVEEGTYEYIGNYSYYNDNDEFTKGEYKMNYTVNDGGGLMSNKMAQIIQEQMQLDYRVDFAVIRYYKGLAVKGVTLRFDFADYFKQNGVNKIVDIYGVEHNVDEIDLLLNTTQAKWSKTSITDLEVEYSKDFYKPYEQILNSLYITKVNKAPSKLKSHTRVNYQVLQNTTITDEELKVIAQEDISYFKRLLDFNDIDAIRLFIGDMVKESREDSEYEEFATISDKLQFELKIHPQESLADKWVRRQIARMITKKIRQLSGGKINMKGGYKIICVDPISYCNFVMNGNTGTNGLNAGEFYIPGASGNRVMYRNPIATYWEVRKIQLTNKLDQWLGDYTNEIIFFNSKDDTAMMLSGCDYDGDGVGVIDNEVLYNSVVSEEYPFINVKEGAKAEPVELNDDNIYESVVKASGNLIGQIAMNNSKLSMICKSVDSYVMGGKATTFRKAEQRYCSVMGIDYDKARKSVRSEVKEMLSQDGVSRIYEDKFTIEERKQFMEQLFKLHIEDYSNLLYASQLAIDMPKTLMPIPKTITNKYKWLDNVGKPVFLYFLDKAEDCTELVSREDWRIYQARGIEKSEWWLNVKEGNNYEDKFNRYIRRELLKVANETKNGATSIKKMIDRMKYNYVPSEHNEGFEMILDTYKAERKLYLGDTDKLNLVDLRVMRALDKLKTIFNMNDNDIVANVIKYRAKIDSRFLRTFLWEVYTRKVLEQPNVLDGTWSYELNANGDIDWMYKKYTRKYGVYFEISNIQKDTNINILNKTNNLIEIGVGGLGDTQIIDELISVEVSEYVTKDGEVKPNYEVVLNGNKVGYVYPNCADRVEYNVEYKVIDVKYNRNSATIKLEVLE